MLLQIRSSLHSESSTFESTFPCSNPSFNSLRSIIKNKNPNNNFAQQHFFLLCSTASLGGAQQLLTRSSLNSFLLSGAQQLLTRSSLNSFSSLLNSLFAQQPLIAQQRTTNVELIELARWQFYLDFLIEFMLVVATTCTQKPINLNRALQNGDALASVPIVNSIRK